MKRRGGFLRVNNLSKYQHYEAKNPAWVKLYASVLDDYDFAQLPDESKYHAIALIPLASRIENHVPDDSVWVGQKISARSDVDLALLVSIGFLGVCDCDSCSLKNPEKSCKNLDPEKRRDRVEGETERDSSLRSESLAPTSSPRRYTAEVQTRMKDAIVSAMGWDAPEVTKAQWGSVENAAKAIWMAGGDESEVKRRAAAHKSKYDWKLSPSSLAKWWPDLGRKRTNHDRPTDPRTEANLLAMEAQDIGRDREDWESISRKLGEALDQDDPVDAVKAVRSTHGI